MRGIYQDTVIAEDRTLGPTRHHRNEQCHASVTLFPFRVRGCHTTRRAARPVRRSCTLRTPAAYSELQRRRLPDAPNVMPAAGSHICGASDVRSAVIVPSICQRDGPRAFCRFRHALSLLKAAPCGHQLFLPRPLLVLLLAFFGAPGLSSNCVRTLRRLVQDTRAPPLLIVSLVLLPGFGRPYNRPTSQLSSLHNTRASFSDITHRT
ncbi:hypothetical protein BV25DRAFT_946097 [Artomyces pyxidatus]|uniref:Uncharacterized protein n=1 Tax=Artomyces pyxidatus TaxID=48021 RepID=A0ACB8SXJ9_9AGAM|nr:hypothetical protein BV25DRAFT_946097 [Artomyces pyxidatus]